ncbi:hypothetical protein ABZ260_12805 [Streptosporangium sp. NPDC006013]|uniref:hypothetical protein n=1 Tax=Streptosporangium sp. NPDC006013 TaxID=3155596 RepID=UPI0033A3D80D
MTLADSRERFARTLAAIRQHQQGHHGWGVLHRTLGELLASRYPALDRLLNAVWTARPHISDAHLITLIGAAVRQVVLNDQNMAGLFGSQVSPATRLGLLRELVGRREEDLTEALCGHSNSFTGARRFLVPQLIIGGFAMANQLSEVRFLDIGTGLGILPRQLNNRIVYDRFSRNLDWSPRAPGYRKIPLASRYGIDAPPLPDLDWVRTCHGPSPYYEERFEELVWSLRETEGMKEKVTLRELDMLDIPELARFIAEKEFNVITCSFVLFQYDMRIQDMVKNCILTNMASPGLFLVMNPSHGLLRQGCRVEGHLSGDPAVLHLADVSDAHFIGTVTRGADLRTVIGEEGDGGD